MLTVDRRAFAAFAILMFMMPGCRKAESGVHIIFAGDLLLDRGVRTQIEQKGAKELFAHVRPVFAQADAVVANLECPVTEVKAPIYKRYVFRGEPAWLKVIRDAGITHLCMANNHSYDQGRAGLKDTYSNLLRNGLKPLGYGSSQQEACAPVIIEKNGVRVALFSSVLLKLEGWAYLPDSAGMCQASIEELSSKIIAFKKHDGNCRVVVLLHWGAEFRETPMPEQRMQAEQLVDAGADVVIGAHPHVVQPMSVYKGRPIFFSIGNFVFDQLYPEARKGEMVALHFTPKALTWEVVPFDIRSCAPFPR